jgi:N-acetylmuramoyl-L-alanine amidase
VKRRAMKQDRMLTATRQICVLAALPLAAICFALSFSQSAAAIEWDLRKVLVPNGLPALTWGKKKTEQPLLKPVVFRLRAVKRGAVSRLEVTTTRKIEVDAFLLAKPDRVIVDLPEVLFQLPQPGKRAGKDQNSTSAGLIRAFRYGSLAKGRSRIVVDLKGPAKIAKVSVVKIASTVHRIRVDILSSGKEEFIAAAQAGRRAALERSRKEINTIKGFSPVSQGKPLVVIDPGHGGIDGGARGPSGRHEKEIVFAFSRELAEQLKKTGKFKILLTRDTDVFIPLGERVAIARRAKAQLFISVHADSLSQKWVRGATVYTVSERASDRHAARLAEKENRADEKAGYEAPKENTEISDILHDLTRRETRTFSHIFARDLIVSWSGFAKLNKNPHRAGNFHVLKAPDVPSVLLELGYLSSEQDAALLTTKKWRSDAASKVALAVGKFFASRKGASAQTAGRQVNQKTANAGNNSKQDSASK